MNSDRNFVICDLTGTLFHGDDYLPYMPVVKVVQALHSTGHTIVFLTGLRSKHRSYVVKRLQPLGLAPSESIFLLMRTQRSALTPIDFKEEVLVQTITPEAVLLAIDDTTAIVRMYEKHNVPTMLVKQVIPK